MNATQRRRHAAMLQATGYEDGPALTVQSTDGEIPQGRELSFAWLSGTVLTGLTSVLLMGAALYVSFQGQDTFSTAYAALNLAAPRIETLASNAPNSSPAPPTPPSTRSPPSGSAAVGKGVGEDRRNKRALGLGFTFGYL